MFTGYIAAFVIAVVWVFYLTGPWLIWFLLMRPYIRKMGETPAMAASWDYSQLVDFSKILQITRERHMRIPWFIYVWGGLILSYILISLVLIMLGVVTYAR